MAGLYIITYYIVFVYIIQYILYYCTLYNIYCNYCILYKYTETQQTVLLNKTGQVVYFEIVVFDCFSLGLIKNVR